MKNLYKSYLALSGWGKFGVLSLIFSALFLTVHLIDSEFLAWSVGGVVLAGVCYVVYNFFKERKGK